MLVFQEFSILLFFFQLPYQSVKLTLIADWTKPAFRTDVKILAQDSHVAPMLNARSLIIEPCVYVSVDMKEMLTHTVKNVSAMSKQDTDQFYYKKLFFSWLQE